MPFVVALFLGVPSISIRVAMRGVPSFHGPSYVRRGQLLQDPDEGLRGQGRGGRRQEGARRAESVGGDRCDAPRDEVMHRLVVLLTIDIYIHT